MTGIWFQVALILGLALIAAMIAARFRISTALTEIIVGMCARTLFAATVGVEIFSAQEPWVKTLAGLGRHRADVSRRRRTRSRRF